MQRPLKSFVKVPLKCICEIFGNVIFLMILNKEELLNQMA